MIDINTLRFAVQLNKLDNSQLPASPLVVEDLLDRIEKAAKEHAALRAELSTEKGWIEDYKKQIVSLQNRLEASEHECTEQARLNGMGASREAALMAKLEAAEKSDAESIAMYRNARDERDALRAKIEAMERQVPICLAEDLRYAENLLPALGLMPEDKLYALPGAQAQNAPSVPDGWKLVPIEPTPTMITAALESSHAINAHRAEHCYRAMLAAAPEAKP